MYFFKAQRFIQSTIVVNYMYKVFLRLLVSFLSLTGMALPAFALESIDGQIADIYISGGANFGYRVSLVGRNPICSAGSIFAYVNDTDSNYKVFVSNLMLAYYTKKQISLIMEPAGNYCHIIEIWIY